MESTSPSTSQSLVRHVQQGDPQAWQRFAALYVPLVYQWMRRDGLQSSDALDVVQNVFIAILRNLATFRRDQPHHSLRAWLRTVARNAMIDWRRVQGRHALPLADDHPQWNDLAVESSEADAAPPLEERMLIVLQAAEIVRAEFEPATWEMFWQLTAEDRTAAQIASSRGVSTWAVYKAKARVLARLREFVGDFMG